MCSMTNRATMRRAYEEDPLAFAITLIERHGEAGGREAFFKVVENDDAPMAEALVLAGWAVEVLRGERKYNPMIRGVISSPPERTQ